MKDILDYTISVVGLILICPILLICMGLIWAQDNSSPFYLGERVGRNGRIFKMIKLRSMVKNADKTGVDSTSALDSRITPLGSFIRRFKLDEIPQLFNILKGEMSLVGPRPNVKREVDIYTSQELRLLTVKPGITDISSIVFSDEGEILKDKEDPDIAYNQLIRPWKSKLGLFYIDNQSFLLDLKVIMITGMAIISRDLALRKVSALLKSLNAPEELITISLRKSVLEPTPPPGATFIVKNRSRLS
jgi:lipopolysaccharide/colanic/teichoic acid biosynthesis glycosyltransferase